MSFCSLCRCTDIPTYHPAQDHHHHHLKCITLSLTLTRSPTSIPSWVSLHWTILKAPLLHPPHLPMGLVHLFHLHPLPLRRNRLVFEDEWKRILSAPIFIEVERICEEQCAVHYCCHLMGRRLSRNIFTMPKNSQEEEASTGAKQHVV